MFEKQSRKTKHRSISLSRVIIFPPRRRLVSHSKRTQSLLFWLPSLKHMHSSIYVHQPMVRCMTKHLKWWLFITNHSPETAFLPRHSRIHSDSLRFDRGRRILSSKHFLHFAAIKEWFAETFLPCLYIFFSYRRKNIFPRLWETGMHVKNLRSYRYCRSPGDESLYSAWLIMLAVVLVVFISKTSILCSSQYTDQVW